MTPLIATFLYCLSILAALVIIHMFDKDDKPNHELAIMTAVFWPMVALMLLPWGIGTIGTLISKYVHSVVKESKEK